MLFSRRGEPAATTLSNAGDRLRELTAAFEEPVLGWFTYRADTSLAPSMREQVHPVHTKPKTAPCAFPTLMPFNRAHGDIQVERWRV